MTQPRQAGSESVESNKHSSYGDSVYRLPAQRQRQGTERKHDAQQAGKAQHRTDEHRQQAILLLAPFDLSELPMQSDLIEQVPPAERSVRIAFSALIAVESGGVVMVGSTSGCAAT
jgi:hypothetical protein